MSSHHACENRQNRGAQIAYGSAWLLVAMCAAPLSSLAGEAKLEVLHEFTGPDGSLPTGGVVVDPKTGTLFGTTEYGGSGYGTVFMLTRPKDPKGKWTFESIYAFKGVYDGALPESGLARVPSSGNEALYGTTRDGSTNCTGCGTIYVLSRKKHGDWEKTTIHDFAGDTYDGIIPSSAPYIDPKNPIHLYGTTGSIGSSGGTIYQMDLSDPSNFKVIYNPAQNIGTFVGYHPQGVAVDDAKGTIYGVAYDGAYEGTIFRMKENGGATILHGFSGPDGLGPLGAPILSPGGTLYGTTVEGGNPKYCPNSPGCGTVWKLARPSFRHEVLHSFKFFTNNKDGMLPISPLVLDPQAETLYGTTIAGGTGKTCGGDGGSCGIVFRIDVNGNYDVIWEFPHGGPAVPQGELAFYDGAIYGTSWDGGKACPDQHYLGCGTVWKLTP